MLRVGAAFGSGCEDCRVAGKGGRELRDLGDVVRDLSPEVLREIVASAVDRHDDVERHVRLAAAREEGDLAQLRAEVDRGLRTRRFLGYRESSEWARAARPVVDELRLVAASSPSRDLVAVVERAIGHVVKVIMHADDSNGTIGDLARELLEVHAEACDAGVAEPVKLAAWMVRFSCEDQDFFQVDPVRYAGALGEHGLLAYRRAIEERDDAERLFAVRWARERLAVLDGDEQAIVALLGGDLSAPHQFIRVCEAMAELGREEEVLLWARRGITETDGWQIEKLYGLACAVHERRSAPLEVLSLRREQHNRMASASTYSLLRRAADVLGAWDIERDAARLALRERDLGGLVDALLDDGDVEGAWNVAHEDPDWDPGSHRRLRLAEAREAQRPEQALPYYMLVADEMLLETGRRAYASAVPVLKHARRAADAAGQGEWFTTRIADLREQHRRRPTFIAMLDKAGLG
jgi:hypothetical protein